MANVRDNYSGYGYLWWVAVNGNHYPKVDLPDGSVSAWGAGGHVIAVISALNLVVVHRANTDDPAKKVTLEQFGEVLHLILAARNQIVDVGSQRRQPRRHMRHRIDT